MIAQTTLAINTAINMTVHAGILHTQDGIRYEVFGARHLDEAIRCLCVQFSALEPMSCALKLSISDHLPFVTLVCQQAARDGLSGVAVDGESGELVGCLIAHDLVYPPADGIETVAKRMAPILALLDTLEEQFRRGRAISPGTHLHVLMVASRLPNRGISTTLYRVLQPRARTLGFQKLVVEPTGIVSQHVLLKKLGQQIAAEIPYASFVFEGEHVFETIAAPPSCLLTVGDL
jgi:hypothetical protein